MAGANAQGAPLTLLVAGDGPLRAKVDATASGTVRILGQREDPSRLLAAADIFVMPSQREGQSVAVLEAMRAGLALVVSDGVGNPEAVGDAGWSCPSATRARSPARWRGWLRRRASAASSALPRASASASTSRSMSSRRECVGYETVLSAHGLSSAQTP